MVVFSAARQADSKLGVEAREATEDELPDDVAADRERRGYVEIIGEGSSGTKKTPADRRRERQLAAREQRRNRPLVSDTGGTGTGREPQGELGGHNAADRAALAERQEDLTRGEREGAPGAIIADGPGTQSASTPRSQETPQSGAQGELSGATADAVGDGASAILPENALNVALEARRDAIHGEKTESAPAKRTRAPRKATARTRKAGGAKKTAAKAKAGQTANPADAPVE